ncbi:MAG: GSCFA domain-containing protein [Tannerella sp.]|nr:GSCFA domain-containing protein [Tannerella sp.]
MNFRTPISIQRPRGQAGISYRDAVMLLGSCFAENIGKRLTDGKFNAEVNPFGILYNPASTAEAVRRLLQPEAWSEKDLFFHEGLYHSWAHHSRFSAVSPAESLHKINERLYAAAAHLRQTGWLLATFGTAYVYRLKETGQVVANCHKLPDRMFVRERLSVSHIAETWDEALARLWRLCPATNVLFTVSPVRHWKDGAHENQLSKSVLLLAIEQLQARHPRQVLYFPAYELMMDELRDYRFYAEDMLHPSATAIQYLWERFAETWLEAAARETLDEVTDIQRALNHRPLNPQSEAHKQFLSQTLLKVRRLCAKNPYLCLENEVRQLHEIPYQENSRDHRGEI